MVGESRCYPKAIVAADLSLYRLHFGSSGSVHDGSLERTRHVCSVDSSSVSVEWHFSTVLEQVVAVGNTVVAVAVAVELTVPLLVKPLIGLFPVLSVVLLWLILLVMLVLVVAGVLPMSTTILLLTVLSVRVSCLIVRSVACVTLWSVMWSVGAWTLSGTMC